MKSQSPQASMHTNASPMCIDSCSISSCGINATSMPHDEIEHASMHIGVHRCLGRLGSFISFLNHFYREI